jgi:hypothetical protein
MLLPRVSTDCGVLRIGKEYIGFCDFRILGEKDVCRATAEPSEAVRDKRALEICNARAFFMRLDSREMKEMDKRKRHAFKSIFARNACIAVTLFLFCPKKNLSKERDLRHVCLDPLARPVPVWTKARNGPCWTWHTCGSSRPYSLKCGLIGILCIGLSPVAGDCPTQDVFYSHCPQP